MFKSRFCRLAQGQNKILYKIVFRVSFAVLFVLVFTTSIFSQDTLKTFPPLDNRWALILGVSTYKDSSVKDLQYCEKDAQEIATAMTSLCRVPKSQMQVLTNSEVTREAIRRYIGWLADNAKANDEVFIYFSGHGSRVYDRDGDEQDNYDECLVPYDYLSSDNYSLITDDEFALWLRNIRSESVFLIMDCCFSGGAARVKGLSNPSIKGEIDGDDFVEDLKMELPRKGFALLAASTANQVSFEDPSLKNGLFTHFLLKGLSYQSDRNRNGVVSDSELFLFVQNKVENFAIENHGRPQEPIFLDMIEGEMEIAFLPIKTSESSDNAEIQKLKYQMSKLGYRERKERITFLRRILLLDPKDSEAAYNLAKEYKDLKNIDSTVYYYDYSVALEPWRVSLINRGKGECFEDAGMVDYALVHYKLWFENSKDPAALNRMARLNETIGKEEEAIALCIQSINLEELQWDAYIRLLNIYFLKGDYKSAVGVASKGLEFNPENLEMMYRMGLLQKFHSGNVVLGDSLLSLFSKKTGADSILQSAIQRKRETLWIIVSPNDTQQVAENLLLEAIDNYPYYAEFYYALGEYYRNEKKDFKLAKKYYMDFIRLNPFTDKKDIVNKYISVDDSKQKTHK